MYHLTASPTYKITPPMFATRCFGTVSVSFSRRKARDKTCSPPEIHLTVLFVHEVLEQTRNMDTFWGGDNFQSFFHTSTRNVVNEVFHGQNALIRPGNHNNTLWRARQLQIVASFVNGKTTWWNLLLQAQKERPSSTMLNPFFPLPPRHRQKAQGFGILIFSQVKKWYLSSDVWVDIFKKMLTVGTNVIFRAPRELHEDFHAWSIFVLPSLITNNPPSKASAKSTCLWTW